MIIINGWKGDIRLSPKTILERILAPIIGILFSFIPQIKIDVNINEYKSIGQSDE